MKPTFVSRQHPERPALIVDGGPLLGYSELHEAIQRLADQLPERELIFIVGENDVPSLTCYLASLARGAVPLLLGKDLAENHLNRLIRTYDPSFVFISTEAGWDDAGSTEQWREGCYALYQRPVAVRHAIHEDLTLLLATSGSTGSPKLVRLSAENLRSNAESIVQYLGITSEERAITTLPLNYSFGLSVINSHLMAGASLVLTNCSLMEGAFWRQVNDHRVTSFAGVPYSYDMLLKLRLARINMPSVRTLTQAGGRLDPVKLHQVNEICQSKGIRFFSMYGQTEATARIAYLPSADVGRKLGSIGKAIPGGRLWLEDDNGQAITVPGVVGELIYAGPNVSMGYAVRPEDLSLGDLNCGVLRTGDLARFDEDGYFFIEGRRHRFLKVFGIRISLDAVEQITAEKGWACAAHGCDDHLVLFIVETPKLTPDALRTEMATSLGLHPSAIKVKPLPELPRLNTGKVDYQCLERLL